MMACESQAGLEAQKLIGISLGKMAASRVGRTGASLHKSLLVASVLHRARHVFLEESYHVHRLAHPEACPQSPTPAPSPPVVAVYTPLLPPPAPTPVTVSVPGAATSPVPVPQEATEAEDKENQQPEQPQQLEQTTECNRTPLSESNSTSSSGGRSRVTALKRRRCVSQQETQEAVWSILPKRPRTQDPPEPQQEGGGSMEVEHITSLVSIFSFGGQRADLCGTEAAREEVAQFQPVALAV